MHDRVTQYFSVLREQLEKVGIKVLSSQDIRTIQTGIGYSLARIYTCVEFT